MGVYERPDSKYWWIWDEATGARFSTKIPVGEGFQRKDSKRNADEVYSALLTDRARKQHRLPVSVPARTFRAHAAWYWEHVAKEHRGKRRSLSILNNLTAHFGDTLLTDLDTDALTEWKAHRAQSVKHATVNREIDMLKPLLASAVPKYLERNPADSLKRFKTPRFVPITILTPDAEDKLLAVATAEERAYVLLGLDTLMRQGDVRLFRVEQNHGAVIDVMNRKTGEAFQNPATKRLQAALKKLTPRDGWYFARLRMKGPKRGTWQPISENTAYQMFTALCDRAKVPRGRDVKGMTYHGLRHTGATRATKATKLTAVMKLGGWSSLRQLARYDHPDQSDLLRGVEAIAHSRPTHARKQTKKNPPKNRRV